MPQLFLTDSTGCIDLVTKNKEGNLGKLLNGEEGVEFGFRFGESLEVGAVDEEDNAVDLREIVAPEATSCVRNNS